MLLIDPKMSLDTIKSYIEVWDCKGCLTDGGTQHNVMAVDDLQYLPTIEAEPVRRGEWNDKGHCSCCGYDLGSRVDKWTNVFDFAFCPVCGAQMLDCADMRGGADNA